MKSAFYALFKKSLIAPKVMKTFCYVFFQELHASPLTLRPIIGVELIFVCSVR